MIGLVLKLSLCLLCAFLFRSEGAVCRYGVPRSGSPRLAGSPFFFALAVTACGRRQGGVGGFAAGGLFWAACEGSVSLSASAEGAAELPASPRPSPSLRFWGGGHCNWSFTFGLSILGHRYHFLTIHAPSIYSPGGLGSSATVENVVPFHFARCGIRCPPAWSKFPRI